MSSNSIYTIEITVTPLNKSGKWGRRCKRCAVTGLKSLEVAKEHIVPNAINIINLIKQDTDTFFVECFLLENGNYIDCDNYIIVYNKTIGRFEYIRKACA